MSGECLACCDILESKENLGRIRPKQFDSLRTKREPPKMKLSKTNKNIEPVQGKRVLTAMYGRNGMTEKRPNDLAAFR